jgi:hypothetical protein
MRRALALLALALLISFPLGCRPNASYAAPTPDLPATVHLGKAPRDPDGEQALQVAVDQGHMPWRLDALEVARADGQDFGFAADDSFTPAPSPLELTPREAVVDVMHDGQHYGVRLVQPIRIGPDAIWIIDDIRVR